VRHLLLIVLVAAACGGDDALPDAPPPVFPYPTVAADPQRAGDPAKGYDYLVNGGYITCGLPQDLYNAAFPPAPADQRIPGRTGDNATLPYGYSAATSSEGVRVVSANCLTCHAGAINNKIVVGLGAADADFTTVQANEVDAACGLISGGIEKTECQRFQDRMDTIAPYTRTLVVGVNPADNLTAALMAHRDPATLAWSDTAMLALPPPVVVPVDVPPWWHMAKKSAMFYSAAGRGDHARIMMAASLLCTDSVAEAQTIDAAFVDVRAWIETLTPPAWPFPVNADLADQGKRVFELNCASCHGTYGSNGDYPNEVIPLDVIGTDPSLATGASQFGSAYVAWFASSFWGETSRLEPQAGYIAPPLDGIWATAPFLHDGSVPTIGALLDSTTRPKYWTRSHASDDYDQTNVGWNFTVVDHGQADEPDISKRELLYDTTLPGYSNAGHTFGDALSAADRTAVIEYLKTL
jgi:mono/diheme cytochrome c family protein